GDMVTLIKSTTRSDEALQEADAMLDIGVADDRRRAHERASAMLADAVRDLTVCPACAGYGRYVLRVQTGLDIEAGQPGRETTAVCGTCLGSTDRDYADAVELLEGLRNELSAVIDEALEDI